MPGNPLVRFDEGRVGRIQRVAPSPVLPSPFLIGNESRPHAANKRGTSNQTGSFCKIHPAPPSTRVRFVKAADFPPIPYFLAGCTT